MVATSSLGWTLVGTSLILTLLLGVVGCADQSPESPESPVEIKSFDPASGTYVAGEEVPSSLGFENTTEERRTFWIGYSVQDAVGRWYDAPAHPVELEPGAASEPQKISWSVPGKNALVSGVYGVKMAVWDREPKQDGSERLAEVSREDAFTVLEIVEDFDTLDRDVWDVTAKDLGRGRIEPGNVSVEDDRLEIKLPADTLDGGELQSRKLCQYGTYRARIKTADAPSSITGFFLYREPDLQNELDIEIFNDPSGRILFTTYAGGEETNNVERELPFDPTEDFHEYRFDFYPGRAEFYVDGELMHSFTEGLPQDPMYLYVNAWFPTWLAGERPEKDSYVYVDWIRH